MESCPLPTFAYRKEVHPCPRVGTSDGRPFPPPHPAPHSFPSPPFSMRPSPPAGVCATTVGPRRDGSYDNFNLTGASHHPPVLLRTQTTQTSCAPSACRLLLNSCSSSAHLILIFFSSHPHLILICSSPAHRQIIYSHLLLTSLSCPAHDLLDLIPLSAHHMLMLSLIFASPLHH